MSFNLLPVTPFDGGNLLGTLFFARRELLQNIFTVISAIALAYLPSPRLLRTACYTVFTDLPHCICRQDQ
jgi:Zn-dependent protease